MALKPLIDQLASTVEGLDAVSPELVAELTAALTALVEGVTDPADEALRTVCEEACRTLQLASDLEDVVVVDYLQDIVDFAQAQVQGCEALLPPQPPAVGARLEGGSDVTPVPEVPTPQDLDAEMLELFFQSCDGYLQEIEGKVLEIDGVADQSESLEEIRRAVHTLKGESGVLSLEVLQVLCHEAESMIDRCIDSALTFPGDPLLRLVDYTKHYVDALVNNQDVPQHGELLQGLRDVGSDAAEHRGDGRVLLEVDPDFADSVQDFIVESFAHLNEAEAAMLDIDSGQRDPEKINLTFRAFHTIKGVAGFLALDPVVTLAHQSETLMDLGRSGELEFSGKEVDLILQSADLIAAMLHALGGKEPPLAADLDQHVTALKAAIDAARVAGEKAAEEEAVAAAPQEDAKAAVIPAKAAGGAPAAPSGSRAQRRVKMESTIKVSTARLDTLVDMVGELVIGQTMVLQDPTLLAVDNQTLQRNIARVGLITRDLQECAMSLRMVTLKSTFQKMSRLVRDVAQKSGKKVHLMILGEDTELDRNVVEEIGDPLVHLIRNAVDHGLEQPEERRKSGKSEAGELVIKAYHQGGSIVIELTDDGRGMDRAKILAKAVERGLVASAAAAEMSDTQVFNLIFQPGFSTAETVTDLSGRGVGMDVVRRNIEALRGKVEVDSQLGEGSTIRMRLPLTLAIIDGMAVQVGDQRYVIPTHSIEQSFRPDASSVQGLQERGEMVRVRGRVLPLYRLKDVLGIAEGVDDVEQGILIVLESGDRHCCLLVDEILGQQQVVIKSLGVSTARIPGVSGGAIMGDGLVALIIDVAGLMAEATAGVGV